MPRINLTSEATAIAVGVVDELAEAFDKKQGYTKPLMSVQGGLRIGGAIVGAVMYSQNMLPQVAEPLMYCASTLATKTVASVVRVGGLLGTPALAPPMARAIVRSQRQLAEGVGVPMHATQKEFLGVRSW